MRSSPDSVRVPWSGLLAMALVAAGLALIGLGDQPLRDFDEGTVAQVALELSQGKGEAALLPTLWGEPYLNKAPGLHSLIGAVIQLSNPGDQLPPEAVVRLMPALLSSLVVPLGGLLQWRLRPVGGAAGGRGRRGRRRGRPAAGASRAHLARRDAGERRAGGAVGREYPARAHATGLGGGQAGGNGGGAARKVPGRRRRPRGVSQPM